MDVKKLTYLDFCSEFKKFNEVVANGENDYKNNQRSALPPLNRIIVMKRTVISQHHLIVSPESCESFHSDGHDRVNTSFKQNQILLKKENK